jgi:hypothetical protein
MRAFCYATIASVRETEERARALVRRALHAAPVRE